jgi:hypothetical protein
MASQQGKLWDLGEPKSRIIDDEDIMVLLPVGFAIEQRGLWYCAFWGDTWHGSVTTSLIRAVEECWTRYNGTGKLRTGVARKFAAPGVDIVDMCQRSFDELL